MGSFLTNAKMPAELRARVEESLRTDALARAGGANRRQGHLLLRLLMLSGVAMFAAFLVVTFQQAEREFQTNQQSLLRRFDQETRELPALRQGVAQLEQHVQTALRPWPSDFLDPVLKSGGPQALDELFERPVVYVSAFASVAALQKSAAESSPDALIRCLMLPPQSARESDLLRHLGRVYEPAALRGRVVGITGASDALAFIDSSFGARLRNLESARLLPIMEQELKRAKLSEATPFLQAGTLVYVVDEPKSPGTVADFDGEAEHYVRLQIVDQKSGALLLGLRRLVDPSWISEKSRLAYSRELNSCRLALQVRKEISQ